MNEEELFTHNVGITTQMDSAAAAVIKAVLDCLGSTDTRISLRDPQDDGVSVYYNLVRGSTDYVQACGQALGLKQVTDDLLEVDG